MVEAALRAMVLKLKKTGRKLLYKHMDVATAMRGLYDFEHRYIVDGYLIVYELGVPWYSTGLVLQEVLVLRLLGHGDFTRIVPPFLERRALEAGAVIAAAGTALAKADRALASLYQQDGWSIAGFTITKEP